MIFQSGQNLQFPVKVLEAQKHHTLLNMSPSIVEGLNIQHVQQLRQAQSRNYRALSVQMITLPCH